jgi:hypothetical protein
VEITELDKDGLARISVATLANLFAAAGGAELAGNFEIRLDATTAVLAAVLVEKILAATADVRSREITAHHVQQKLEQAGFKVVLSGRLTCVEAPLWEQGGPGCCVGG